MDDDNSSAKDKFNNEYYEEREAIRSEAQRIHKTIITRLDKLSRVTDNLVHDSHYNRMARKKNSHI